MTPIEKYLKIKEQVKKDDNLDTWSELVLLCFSLMLAIHSFNIGILKLFINDGSIVLYCYISGFIALVLSFFYYSNLRQHFKNINTGFISIMEILFFPVLFCIFLLPYMELTIVFSGLFFLHKRKIIINMIKNNDNILESEKFKKLERSIYENENNILEPLLNKEKLSNEEKELLDDIVKYQNKNKSDQEKLKALLSNKEEESFEIGNY